MQNGLYKYETHLHTDVSSKCGKSTPEEMADKCKAEGYDGIFVTDHFWGGNTAIDPALPWREWVDAYMLSYERAKARGEQIGLDVFFGWESGFQGTEYLIYGLGRDWLYAHPEISRTTIEEQYRLVHEDGGLVVHAHPFRERSYIKEVRMTPDYEDAVEAINAAHDQDKPDCDPVWNEKAIAYAARAGKPMIAGSDIHTAKCLYGGGILTKKPLKSERDFIRLLQSDEEYFLSNGKTLFDRRGGAL